MRGWWSRPETSWLFHGAAAAHGYPAELLTDNGAVFTAAPRGGRCALELECDRLEIKDINSRRPYHPQTCGKAERFHQTQKRWLAKQDRAATIEELQAARYVSYLLQRGPPAPRDRQTIADVTGRTYDEVLNDAVEEWIRVHFCQVANGLPSDEWTAAGESSLETS